MHDDPRTRIRGGRDLQRAREAMGLSITELARLLRMTSYNSPKHLREMETGARDLSGPVAISVGYLLQDHEEKVGG